MGLLTTVGVLGTGIAWGAGLTLSSARLAGGTLSAPAFYPRALAITATGKAGTISKNDELAATFSGQLLIASICPGLPQQATTVLTGVTVSLVDGGASNDQLTVTAGPVTCLLPRVGSLDLGVTTHMSGATLVFTASRLTITQSGTITLRLGDPSRAVPGSASGATVVRYTPHASITSSTGQATAGTASTTSAVQF